MGDEERQVQDEQNAQTNDESQEQATTPGEENQQDNSEEKGVDYWRSWSRTHEQNARDAAARVAELEKEVEGLTAAAEELRALKHSALVSGILSEFGVSEEALPLITGASEEEIRSQVEVLAKVATGVKREEQEPKNGLESFLKGIIPQGANNAPEVRGESSRDILGLNNIFDTE